MFLTWDCAARPRGMHGDNTMIECQVLLANISVCALCRVCVCACVRACVRVCTVYMCVCRAVLEDCCESLRISRSYITMSIFLASILDRWDHQCVFPKNSFRNGLGATLFKREKVMAPSSHCYDQGIIMPCCPLQLLRCDMWFDCTV